MAELRRTQAGPFTEQDHLVTLQDLQDAYYYFKKKNNYKFLRHCIQPMEMALKYIAKCWILDSTIASLTHGRNLGIPGISKLENFKKEDNDKFWRYCIQPMEMALKYIAKCWILDSTIASLTHGRNLGIPGISKLENFKKGETVAILTLKGELVAIGMAQMSAVEINCSEKGIAIDVQKVFMEAVKKG